MADFRTEDASMSVIGAAVGVPILAVLPAAHNAVPQLMDICLNGLTISSSQDITIVTEDRTFDGGVITVVTKVQVNGSLAVVEGAKLTVHYVNLVEV